MRRTYKNINPRFLAVSCFSAAILLAETVFFKLLGYVYDYLSAVTVISLTVLGIGLGSFLAGRSGIRPRTTFIISCICASLSVYAAFFSLSFFYPFIWVTSIFISLFFAALIFYIVILFKYNKASVVYGFDMFGAACGVLAAFVLYKFFNSETILLALPAVLSFGGICAYITVRQRPRNSAGIIFLAVIFAVSVYAGYACLMKDAFNIFGFIKARRIEPPAFYMRKIFNYESKRELKKTYDNLTGRIDIYTNANKKNYYMVGWDGFGNDHFTPMRFKEYSYYRKRGIKWPSSDRRIFYGIVKEPEVFICGTAACGILKSVKKITPAEKINGVEINPALIKAMKEDFYDKSGRAYGRIYPQTANAISALKATDKKFDIITFINTHSTPNITYRGAPDYLHTAENYNLYFDRLTAKGHLLFEERPVRRRGELSFYRMVNTLYSVLKERGAKDPAAHFLIWEWMTPDSSYVRRNHGGYYISMAVSKEPLSKNREAVIEWIRNTVYKKTKGKPNARLLYFKGFEESSEFAGLFSMIEKKDFSKLKDCGGFDASITTNNRPFLQYACGPDARLKRMVGVSTGAFLLLWCFFIFIPLKKTGPLTIAFDAYNIIIGAAYFFIEIILMQKFQNIFISPAETLLFVLGVLLLSSSAGGFFSGRIRVKAAALCLVPAALLTLYLPDRFLVSGISPDIVKIFSVALISLCGFFMGIYLPAGFAAALRKGFGAYIPRFFAVNSIGSSAAVILGLFTGVKYGYQAVICFALFFYIAAAFLITRIAPGGEQSKAVAVSEAHSGKSSRYIMHIITVLFAAAVYFLWQAGKLPEKVNAHESVQSFNELERLRRINGRFNIKHTVLIGHYDEVFTEGKKWDKDAAQIENNDFVINAAKKFPEEFSAIVLVDPRWPDIEERIRSYIKAGACGVQVYDFMFKKPVDSPEYDGFFRFLESNQIPLYLRTSVSRKEKFRQVDSLLNKYRYLKILIPHYMVAESSPELMRYLLLKHDNLYFDISYGFRDWRRRHLTQVSENIDALRRLFTDYQDRILFGTDTVLSNEKWKNDGYIISSFSDYTDILEKKRWFFSAAQKKLNGFALDKEVLDKIYRGNFRRFFGGSPTAFKNTPAYFTGPVAAESAGEGRQALLAFVSNIFSGPENIKYEKGRYEFSGAVKRICVDKDIGRAAVAGLGNTVFMEKDRVLKEVRADKNTLGVVFLKDIDTSVKLVSVNGVNLISAGMRIDKDALEAYPLKAACRADGVSDSASGGGSRGGIYAPYDYYSVIITGSSLIGQGLKRENAFYSKESLAGGIKDIMKDADITHLSLETSFTEGCRNDIRRYKFCSPVRYFDLLPYTGVDIIGLSGNHLTDFGRQRFERTLDIYNKYNIRYYGGGYDDSFKEITETINLFGNKVSFTGYNDISPASGLAGKGRPGSSDFILDKMTGDLQYLSSVSDIVITDIQGGNEYSREYDYFQRAVAHCACDAGADIVDFLHSHTIKGFEYIKDGICFYGPGNFLFFHPCRDADTVTAFMIKYYFCRDKLVQFELIPVDITDTGLVPGDKAALLGRLEKLFYAGNAKDPYLRICAFGLPEERILSQRRLERLQQRFNITAADNGKFRVVFYEDARKTAAENDGPVIIDSADFLLNGDADILDDENIYALYGFSNLEALEKFRDAVSEDRQLWRGIFIKYSGKILFGGGFFERSISGFGDRQAYIFYEYLLNCYRDLLERDSFTWPNLRAVKRRQYLQDVEASGLDLPDEVLRDIYEENYNRLLNNRIGGRSG